MTSFTWSTPGGRDCLIVVNTHTNGHITQKGDASTSIQGTSTTHKDSNFRWGNCVKEINSSLGTNNLLCKLIFISAIVTPPMMATYCVSDVMFSVHVYTPLSDVVRGEKMRLISSVEILSLPVDVVGIGALFNVHTAVAWTLTFEV